MADSLPPSFQPKRKSIRSSNASNISNASNNGVNNDAGVGAAGNPEIVQPPSFAARRRPVINRENSSASEFADESLRSLARRNTTRSATSGANYSGGVNRVSKMGAANTNSNSSNSVAGMSGQAGHQPPAFAPRRSLASEDTAVEFDPVGRPGNLADPVNPINSANPRNSGRQKKHVGPKRLIVGVLVLILVLVICWPLYLYNRANSQLGRVDALSGSTSTSGTTYLFIGSDSRGDAAESTGVTGQRSDSIILVHKADNGQVAMVSLPRDTYVEIPGYGMNKINASFSFGGAALLVETVENLTGLTIDHYVQIGMDGVGDIVDALGGVELCLDYDVSDQKSQLEWEAGCHIADGDTALAFSRMRYSDPLGDIGRAERQRQVLNAVSSEALSWSLLFSPSAQISLVDSGANALTVDQETTILDIAQLLLALKSATASGLSGTPPIASIAYQTAAGSSVLLDESSVDSFFTKLANGELTEEDFESIY